MDTRSQTVTLGPVGNGFSRSVTIVVYAADEYAVKQIYLDIRDDDLDRMIRMYLHDDTIDDLITMLQYAKALKIQTGTSRLYTQKNENEGQTF